MPPAPSVNQLTTKAAGPMGEAPESQDRLSSIDDHATRAEALQTAGAVDRVRTAATARIGKPGVCGNCDAQLASLAVYCDEDCRADHEHRQKAASRQRAAR